MVQRQHSQRQGAERLQGERLADEEFKGLRAVLELCVGARILLTKNLWVEAGLMNGALGVVRGFMWPPNGDPGSSDTRLRCPHIVFAEFDEVGLGAEADGTARSFFPNDPAKKLWIPIFRERERA